MKTRTIIWGLILNMLILTTLSCKDDPKKNSEEDETEISLEEEQSSDKNESENLEFKDAKTALIFEHYIHMKTAFVNSDSNEVQAAASMLIEATENENIKGLISEMTETEDIGTQRQAFSELSAQVEALLRGSITSGQVYKQFCPMAFNNTGAYWLSKEEEIRNPYFGDQMLSCGKVVDMIATQ